MNVQESTYLMKAAIVMAQILAIYNLLLWVRIIFSWFSSFSNMRQNKLIQYIQLIVDPYLNLFKNIKFLKTNNMDFTPLLAFAVLSVVQSILNLFGATGELTLVLVIVLAINTLWSYLISPFFFILTIMLVIRLVLCFKKSANSINLIHGIENIIGGFMNWIQKVFFFSKVVSDRTLIIASLVFTILVYIVTRQAITYLLSYLLNL
jgi:YggT family protein